MANTDRFYNAPEGPQVQPDVEMPRRARYEISSSPDMFGSLIAKGLTEVGKEATDAYNVYGQVASDQALNGFLADATQIRTDFGNKRGQEAIDAFRGTPDNPGVSQQLQASYDKWRSTVPPGHQNGFDNVGRRYQFTTNSWMQTHFAGQSQEWAKTTATNTEQAAVSAISAHPEDDQSFDLNRTSMVSAAVKQFQIAQSIPDLTAASPEQRQLLENTAQQAEGKAWYYRIEAARAKGNNAQAMQWQQQHADVLGKLGPEVQNQMRGYERKQQVDAGVAEADAHVGAPGTAYAGAGGAHDAGYYSKIPKPSDGVYAKVPPVGEHGEDQLARFKQWNPDPVGNSAANLATVHPDLQAIVRKAQADNPDLPFVVALGKSTPQQEALATSWGWGEPGTGGSHHLQGNVVDLWPLDKQGHVVFDKGLQDKIGGAMKKAAGELGLNLKWGALGAEGGQNKNFRDAPNFELLNPKPVAATVPAAFNRAPPGAQTAMLGAGIAGVRVPSEYAPIVQSSAQKWGIDPTLLARQMQQESGYRDVTSPAGAQGIAQFMPGTASRYGVAVHDAQSSIDGAAHYMHDLQEMFGGNKGLALAGYNWGEANVMRWLRTGADPAHLPQETANYVRTITGHDLSEWVQNPGVPIHTTPLGPGQAGMGPAFLLPRAPQIETPEAPPPEVPMGQATPAAASAEAGGIVATPVAGGAAPPEGSAPQQAAYAPQSGIPAGGALGGAPPVQQPGMETAPPERSPFDIARDNASAAMIYTMNRTDIPEDLKDDILKEQWRRLDQATRAAEQDKATRAMHSQEAVSRAVDVALGQNGQTNAQAGINILDDALHRHLIDSEAYMRGHDMIEKFTGYQDPREWGKAWADVQSGKIPVHTLADLQALAAHGDITRKAYQAIEPEIRQQQNLDEQIAMDGYVTQKQTSFTNAKEWLDWKKGMEGAVSSRDPLKASQDLNKFSSIFEAAVRSYRAEAAKSKIPPDWNKFDLFNTDKLQEKLESIYSTSDRNAEIGTAGLTKPQEEKEDLAWKLAQTHPPAPPGADPDAWRSTIENNYPTMAGGFPMPHQEFDGFLRTLFQAPSLPAQAAYDRHFGPDGDIARGETASTLLGRLRPAGGVQMEPKAPQRVPERAPVVYPTTDIPVHVGTPQPGNILNTPARGPTVHVPLGLPIPQSEAPIWPLPEGP